MTFYTDSWCARAFTVTGRTQFSKRSPQESFIPGLAHWQNPSVHRHGVTWGYACLGIHRCAGASTAYTGTQACTGAWTHTDSLEPLLTAAPGLLPGTRHPDSRPCPSGQVRAGLRGRQAVGTVSRMRREQALGWGRHWGEGSDDSVGLPSDALAHGTGPAHLHPSHPARSTSPGNGWYRPFPAGSPGWP